jgi:hypothetical protein
MAIFSKKNFQLRFLASGKTGLLHNPIAFIKGQEFKVIEARSNLVDRFVQQNLSEQKASAKQEAVELKEKLEDLKKLLLRLPKGLISLRLKRPNS